MWRGFACRVDGDMLGVLPRWFQDRLTATQLMTFLFIFLWLSVSEFGLNQIVDIHVLY